MAGFRRGTEHYQELRQGGELGDAYHLPDEEKERLCRSLLAEFGVTNIRTGGRGELVHGCILPFGNHKDQEAHPTASLNYEKLVYNCFGCDAGGSILWFIGLMREVSGTEARRWLEDQTGLGDEKKSLSLLLQYFDEVYNPEKRIEPPMPRMDPKILEPWMMIHPYMTEIRGVPEETLEHFKIGYGVLRVKIGERQYLDSHRVVIPHFWKGNLVGWQSRRIINDGTPKYKNTPDFPKDRTIYNYDSKVETAVIVESPLSVLSKWHLGHHIESTFGASLTDKQKRQIAAHPKVILFMDNDKSGYKATNDLGEYLSQYSAVWVVPNPWAADAADLDDVTYSDLIEEAVPFSVWSPPTELMTWEREEVLA